MPKRAPRKAIVSEDIFEIRLASSLEMSPDGRRLAWVETRLSRSQNAYQSCIKVTDFDSGSTRQITSGPRDSNPRWSPDGSMLAFVSRRPAPGGKGGDSGGAQIYLMMANGGEAWPLTDLKMGAGAPAWSPDGRRIAFVARIDDRRGLQRAGDADADTSAYARFNDDVLVIRRRKWKLNGGPFVAHRRSHLIMVHVTNGPEDDLPAPRLLVGGELDVNGFCWNPSGDRLAFVTQLDPQAGQPYRRRTELRTTAVGDSATSGNLVLAYSRIESRPAWSPDGKTIAVLGHNSPRGSAAHSRLLLVDPENGNVRSLTDDLDLCLGDSSVSDTRTASSGDVVWVAGGKALMVQVNDAGKVQLLRVPAGGGKIEWLTSGNQQVIDFSADEAGRRVAMVVSEALNPGDIYLLDTGTGERRRLTDLNGEWLAAHELSAPERFVVKADDGVEIEGWVMRPLGFEEGKKYPAILQIHGGPVRHYGYCYFHEMQLLAARGYVVIYGNPRGSQGYSEEFCAAIQGDHGNRDYKDVMQFVDGATASFPFIDADRVGVAGGSYGGFMTNWIIGHTGRFAAAVTMRSVVNAYTEYGTGDRGFQREGEAGGGTPWDNPEGYMRISPIKYIGNCTTPTMVIHSDLDMRCPVDQGELLYAALFRLGVPTEFVRFPGETHELSRSGKPWHRVFRLDKIVEWFDRWLMAR